ncbi:hypothetical protein ACMTN4_01540 (plasmid) [Rhodococcus globerulus]
MGSVSNVFDQPRDDYTKELLDAIPGVHRTVTPASSRSQQ